MTDENSVHAFYKEMLALRRAETDLRDGDTTFLASEEPVLAFVRGDGLVCVFNLSATSVDFTLPKAADPVLHRNAAIRDGITIALAGSGFVIARLRR